MLRAGDRTGPLDLEAVEMAVRSSMHQAGAAVLDRLLEFDPPSGEHRQLPCSCGHAARYVELRSKPVLTAVGKAECLRPYYLCEHCHRGQFPGDVELDIENTEFSPGVRRRLAAVGHEAPFQQGRQPMELLAGLSLTTKAVERTAEAIGEDIEVLSQDLTLQTVPSNGVAIVRQSFSTAQGTINGACLCKPLFASSDYRSSLRDASPRTLCDTLNEKLVGVPRRLPSSSSS